MKALRISFSGVHTSSKFAVQYSSLTGIDGFCWSRQDINDNKGDDNERNEKSWIVHVVLFLLQMKHFDIFHMKANNFDKNKEQKKL